jgi:hypothetical protein
MLPGRIIVIALFFFSCNDGKKATLFDTITKETCRCSEQQTIGVSAAIAKCIMQASEKNDAELTQFGIDHHSPEGLKQLQYEVAVRMESRCREVYMKVLKESAIK